MKHKIEPFLVKIDKAATTSRKKKPNLIKTIIFPILHFDILHQSYIILESPKYAKKLQNLQQNFTLLGNNEANMFNSKQSCLFVTILDCKERNLTWNKFMSHLTAAKDASVKTFTCLSIHNFNSLHSILLQ